MTDTQKQQITSVFLHPLVILNVSDHWTRSQMRCKGELKKERVVGALMGTQSGKNVTIRNSFAVPWLQEAGRPDWNYLIEKMGWQKQVYENYEVLGWYSAGAFDLEEDMEIHRQLMALELMNEIDPLYFCIDGYEDGSSKSTKVLQTLPVKIFQAEVKQKLGSDELRHVFNQAAFIIVTEESERIAVDEIAKSSSVDNQSGSSGFNAHLKTLDHSLSHMIAHVDILLDYLRRIQ